MFEVNHLKGVFSIPVLNSPAMLDERNYESTIETVKTTVTASGIRPHSLGKSIGWGTQSSPKASMPLSSQPIRLLHHLARSGGTLISRCLASMQGVTLLSEINPAGTQHFNPMVQARNWHDLVTDEEVRRYCESEDFDFQSAMRLIRDRCHAKDNRVLVLRDWSHIDFIGFPFNQRPTLQFELRNALTNADEDGVRSVASVRHPIDQYLSMRRLAVLSNSWNEELVWRGIRVFAEAIQGMPWIRFEDFLRKPDETLEFVCHHWGIPLDASYRTRWHQYPHITGDMKTAPSPTIEPRSRRPVADEDWKRFATNPDFFRTLDILGYPTPARFRPTVFTMPTDPTTEKNGKAGKSLTTDHWIQQAHTKLSEGDPDGAIAELKRALQIDPACERASNDLIDALLQTGEHRLALAETGRILDLDPLQEGALRQHVLCLEQLGRKFDAIPLRRRLVELCPEDRENQFTLANLLTGVGGTDESIALYRDLLSAGAGQSHEPNWDGAATNYLLNLNYSDRLSPAEIANEHFRVGMRFAERPRVDIHRSAPADGRVRVGYLSSDLYVHPVGKIMRSILPCHDRSQFQITTYYDNADRDGLTAQIEQDVETFRHVGNWSDDRLAQQIDEDQIDVLFDLGGYTAGGNRLRILARRAAPVQISFLGYPNTSALPTIDYRITDRMADPPGLTDRLYGERSLYLESGFLSWCPYDLVRNVTSERTGTARIGSFNNVAKISPRALRCWAEIMCRTPGIHLVLKYGDRFGAEIVCDRYRRMFAEYGVLPDRLEFRRTSDTLQGHLELMADVDLALDSFPYQGTMTSLECLSVGTPVLSLCGDYYAHRATSAMMMRLELQELIASDPEEYVELAVQLLADLPTLRQMRPEIRDRFLASDLTRPERFVHELESTLLRLTRS